jgi:Mg2+ and Co2+ transporter CorA
MANGKVGSNITYILQHPTPYVDRSALWSARPWKRDQDVKLVAHQSLIYHYGCPTLAQLLFPWDSKEAKAQMENFTPERDLASPFDEQIFYWTKVASKDLVQKVNERSSNAAYYLLKHVAQHWTSQLELINYTIAMGEFLSDDYQATLKDDSSQQQWKKDLIQVTKIAKDINYLERQMHHFRRAMILNLERLGIQIGCERVDAGVSFALRGAQSDLLTIHTRMRPLRERVEALTSIASDLTNLHAAFRGLHDGELGLWLGLAASIVFPLTLVANIFSMSDDYLPGARSFWKFWAISLPFAIVLGVVMVYGGRPDRFLYDVGGYVGLKRQVKIANGVDGTRGENSGNSMAVEAGVNNMGGKQTPKARAESSDSPC